MASSVVNGAHADGQNQQFSTIGVIGTLGTADSQGTARTLPFAVDPLTGAAYVNNIGTSTTVNVASGTINAGTTTISSGTMQLSGTPNVNVITGTLNAGTVTVGIGTINAGTINVGTINAGTFRNDGRPSRNILSFGSTFTFAGSNFATIVGSASIGVGTSLWVNDLSIVSTGQVTAGIMFGSNINGTAVLAKGNFGTQGGIEKSFPMSVNAGMTNTDLNCWVNGAGTIDVTVSYFISA